VVEIELLANQRRRDSNEPAPFVFIRVYSWVKKARVGPTRAYLTEN
jgi:hypothetical protein